MSPKSLSRILVAHTYGTVTDNHIPSQGEVIVARGGSPLPTPLWPWLSTFGSGRDLPSHDTCGNYHHAVVNRHRP
jgi:hypothetical protein